MKYYEFLKGLRLQKYFQSSICIEHRIKNTDTLIKDIENFLVDKYLLKIYAPTRETWYQFKVEELIECFKGHDPHPNIILKVKGYCEKYSVNIGFPFLRMYKYKERKDKEQKYMYTMNSFYPTPIYKLMNVKDIEFQL